MRKFDVAALGELLVDFTENGISENGNPLLEANPGGAPCNVLAMLSRLGKKTAFIGKVGADSFGRMLKETAKSVGINTDNVSEDGTIPTTLAFVHTLSDGDREFSFYRNPGADMALCEADVNENVIADSGIFHFGTLSMTDLSCRNATKKAVEAAKKYGAVISFDPNLRFPLWNDMDLLRECVFYGLSVCDVLKISDNEIEWLTGSTDYISAVKKLKAEYKIPLVFATLGKDGSMAFSDDGFAQQGGFSVNTIETTGAGDTFFGCILKYISDSGLKNFSSAELSEMLGFANAAAALITTRKGALKVMPTADEIKKLINL